MLGLTETSRRLNQEFFARDTLAVAPDLINKLLVTVIDGAVTAGRIVETEAYSGIGDSASHAFRGITPRTAVMFGEPGRAYVYFSYGMHNLFNIVTERSGTAGAVLIRAVEPIQGIEVMRTRRGRRTNRELCSGPGKLTSALGITLLNNKESLLEPDSAIGVFDDGRPCGEVLTGPRVGISSATELPWRFFLRDCAFISRP